MTTPTYPTAWVRGSATVSLSAYDATSGVAATYYSKTGGTPTTRYTGPFTVTSEGQSTVKYYSVDGRGNAETVQQFAVKVDNTAPETTDNAAESYVGTATVALTPSDPLSGVAATRWRVDGGTWTTGTVASIPYVANSRRTLQWYSIDAAGNSETINSSVFDMPSRYEQTDARMLFDGAWSTVANGALSGGNYLYAWKAGQTARIGFTGTKFTWVTTKATNYGIATLRLDGGPPVDVDLYSPSYQYRQSVFSTGDIGDGYHYVEIAWTGRKNPASSGTYVGVDAADVMGDLAEADRTLPVTTDDAPEGWVSTATVSVSLTATDAVTPVTATYFSIDAGSPTTPYTAPVAISSEGTTTLTYFSVDSRSNTETAHSTLVRIDRTAPSTTDNAPAGWQTAPVDVALSTMDAGCGVATTYTKVDGGDATVYSGPLHVSKQGITEIEYWSVDKLGHEENHHVVGVWVDLDAPITSSDASSTWLGHDVAVALAAVDPVSGVSSIAYRLNGGGESPYSTPVVIDTEGTTTVTYRATDVAGNVEAPRSDVVRIDKTPPTVSMSPSAEYADVAVVPITALDSVSSIGSVKWRINGGSWNVGTTATCELAGHHVLDVLATDLAGNVATTSATLAVRDRVEQSDTHVVYVGGWATATSGQLSGGNYLYAWKGGQRAHIAFEGTRLDWITTKATNYGIASVSVDGAEPVDVDLYRSAYAYRQLVWSTGELSPGRHEVSISWTGRKNAASTGSLVGIDALDVVGALAEGDITAPVTSSDVPTAWCTTDTTITLTPVDAQAGISATYYRLDSGNATTYTAPFRIAAQGTTGLEFWSVDNRGNVESAKSATLRMDKDAPSTLSDAPISWQTSGVSVSLVASDAVSGATGTYYRLNGGAPLLYALPIAISAEGSTTVTYWTVDAAGNAEQTKTALIRIDTTAPDTSATAMTEWLSCDATVTLTANDALSGVAATRYSVNGGDSADYWAPLVVSEEGTTTVAYASTDAAGNAEPTDNITVRVDKTPPSIDTSIPVSVIGTATVSASASDTYTGVSALLSQFDNGDWLPTASVTTTLVGEHSIRFRATDGVGNMATSATTTFTVLPDIVRVDDTHPTLAYSEEFTTSSDIALYGGTHHTTNKQGAVAVFNWSGTRLDLIATKAPNRGRMSVALDGQAPVTVDLYSPSYGYKQTVFSTGQLSPGAHTLRVDVIGDKNANSSGTNVGIDALDVAGYLTASTLPPRASTRYEQTDGRIAFGGTWTDVSSQFLSAGTYRYTGTSDSAFRVTFTGTRLDWITSKAPSYGIASVRVDGGAPTQVDLYAASYAYKQAVWSTGVLTNAPHTVDVSWTGSKSPGSTGTNVGLDAVDVYGTLTQAPAIVPPSSRFEETSTALLFEGDNWTATTAGNLSGGSYRWTGKTGTALVKFTGTRMDWVTTKAGSYGIARVSVDNGAWTDVDLYSATYAYRQVVFTTGPLANAAHTVRIEWTGRKNSSSSNTYVGVDAVDITSGALTQAFESYEETATTLIYDGDWTTSTSGALSGGQYRYAYQTGGAVNVKFAGTRLDWITTKAPNYGSRVSPSTARHRST